MKAEVQIEKMNKNAIIVAEGYNKIGSVYDEWAKTARVAERDKYIAKIKERCPRGGIIARKQASNKLEQSIPSGFSPACHDLDGEHLAFQTDNVENVSGEKRTP